MGDRLGDRNKSVVLIGLLENFLQCYFAILNNWKTAMFFVIFKLISCINISLSRTFPQWISGKIVVVYLPLVICASIDRHMSRDNFLFPFQLVVVVYVMVVLWLVSSNFRQATTDSTSTGFNAVARNIVRNVVNFQSNNRYCWPTICSISYWVDNLLGSPPSTPIHYLISY